MAPHGNHPSRPPRRLPKRRPLNFRQQEFARHFVDPNSPGFLNATAAAGCAHYRGKRGSVQLSVQGHRLVRNPNVWDEIMRELHAAGATLKACGRALARALGASETCELQNADGEVVLASLPNYKIQLEAVGKYLRLLDLYGRHSSPTVMRHGTTKKARKQVEEFGDSSGVQPIRPADLATNRFTEMTPNERMAARDAVSAAEVWAEIEKRTAAARKKCDPGQPNTNDVDPAKDGGDG